MTAVDELDKVMDKAEEVVQANIPPTVVFFVLDESSSMSSVRDETIAGVNEILTKQAAEPGVCYFSLTKFATRVDSMGDPVEVGTFPKLTSASYKPNGNTALYDAIGLTIERAEEWLKKVNLLGDMDGLKLAYQVLFVIQTDGQENASEREGESIRRLISKKTEDKWDFVFTGADQDAILAAGRIGISQKMSAGYSGTKGGTTNMLRATSDSLSSYRSEGRDAVTKRGFYGNESIADK